MASRLILQDKLKELTNNVYFQPPSSTEMNYPCIRYILSTKDVQYADNEKYKNTNCYQVTIIDEDPDSDLPDKIESLPLSAFDRFYPSDDLNHWVYNLYF